MRKTLLIFLVIWSACLQAKTFVGRIVDEKQQPLSYTTVYPVSCPEYGTATGSDGVFTFTIPDSLYRTSDEVVISFIGYKKEVMPLMLFLTDTATIALDEQPISLEEAVVAAKASKQKNKRKQMASLLHQVMVQMDADFAHSPSCYRVVSDVRMDSEGEAWGMEQMISRIVHLPDAKVNGKDSTQFAGEFCKRYFKSSIRSLADTILAGDDLDKDLRKMAVAMDSGVVVHKGLWMAGNIQEDMEEESADLRHWTVSNESENETVLTFTEKKNVLGIYKYIFTRHFILDSETLSVLRFSEKAEFWLNIPFGHKLKPNELQILNLLNMGDRQIDKFRLRKAHALVTLNTFYQRKDGYLYTLEKNLQTSAQIVGTKDMEIPVEIRATQRVTNVETSGVRPMKAKEMTKRVPRRIVEVY